MPPSPDDKLASVRKGVKSLFRSRSQRRGTQGSEDAPSSYQGGSLAEAPNSTATPQLTTSIPGASLGADLPPTRPRDVPGASQEPPPPPPIIPRRSYAEGMSATSGPLGGSLEEVEHFEKFQERRASVKSQDESMASAAAAATRNVPGIGQIPSETSTSEKEANLAAAEASGVAAAQKTAHPDADTEMTDA